MCGIEDQGLEVREQDSSKQGLAKVLNGYVSKARNYERLRSKEEDRWRIVSTWTSIAKGQRGWSVRRILRLRNRTHIRLLRIYQSQGHPWGVSYLPNSRYEINSSVLKGKSEKKGESSSGRTADVFVRDLRERRPCFKYWTILNGAIHFWTSIWTFWKIIAKQVILKKLFNWKLNILAIVNMKLPQKNDWIW